VGGEEEGGGREPEACGKQPVKDRGVFTDQSANFLGGMRLARDAEETPARRKGIKPVDNRLESVWLWERVAKVEVSALISRRTIQSGCEREESLALPSEYEEKR